MRPSPLVLAVLLGGVLGVRAGLAQDACVSAPAISVGFPAAMGNLNTSSNDGFSTCGVSNSNPDDWYSFTTATGGDFVFSTCGTHDGPGVDLGMDTVLAAFPFCGGAQLSCNDDGACGGLDTGVPRDSRIALTLAPGQQVLVRVSFFGGSIGNGDYLLNVEQVFDPPTNVTCNSSVPGQVSISWIEPTSLPDNYNVYRDNQLLTTVPAGTTSYTYVVPGGAMGSSSFCVESSANGGAALSPLACCTGILAPAVNDQCSNATPAFLGLNSLDTTAATTDGLGVNTGTCNQWGGDAILHNDIWHTYTVSANGLVRVATCNIGNFDSKMVVWNAATAACPPDPMIDTPLGCQDDGCSGFTTELTFIANSGDQLLIQIGGFNALTTGIGQFVIEDGLPIPLQPVDSVSCDSSVQDQLTIDWVPPTSGPTPAEYNVYFNGVPVLGSPFAAGTTSYTLDVTGLSGVAELCVEALLPSGEASSVVCCSESYGAPTNDDCANAIVLSTGATNFSNSLAQASLPTWPCGNGGSDIWFRFTGTGHDTTISLCGSAFDTVLQVFDTDTCPPTAASSLVCNDDSCGGQSQVTLFLAAGVDYLFRVGGFFGQSGGGTLDISLDCGGVAPLTCSYSCATDEATVTWSPNAGATSYTLLDGGVVVGTAPAGSSSLLITSPGPGVHQYELTWDCIAGGQGTPAMCTLDVPASVTIPAGTTDVVLQLEGSGGFLDSASAIEQALLDNARSTIRLPIANLGAALSSGCLDLSAIETLWLATGTFPNDYRLTAHEGDAIAALAATGIGIYLESGDHWGLQHVPSDLDGRDGIEEDLGANINDGDGTFTQMDGVDAVAAGLLLAAHQDVHYEPDNMLDADFNDWLSPIGTTPGSVGDPSVSTAEPIWVNSEDMVPLGDPEDAIPYVTGVIALHLDGGVMLSKSWEFGGFALDPNDPFGSEPARASLMASYLSALGRGTSTDNFERGDCNDDGAFNIADAVFLLGNLFPPPGGPSNSPNCVNACDGNDDGSLNIADAVAMLNVLFPQQGQTPSLPQPFGQCGPDGTPSLDCVLFSNCP